MLRATFLGHNGWLLETQEARVLIDPLLRNQYGNHVADSQQFLTVPQRKMELKSFPEIDAVIISHEHPDHFDIRSFAFLSTEIPVYLSGASSIAAHTILAEMGFTVCSLTPGETFTIGDLELTPMCADHFKMNNNDEWDCLSLFVYEKVHGGALFACMDVVPTSDMFRRVKGLARHNRLLAFRDGLLRWSPYTYLEQVIFYPGTPQNQKPGYSDGHLEAAQNMGEFVLPGDIVVVTGDQIISQEKSLFIQVYQPEVPNSGKQDFAASEYPPLTGKTELTKEGWAELSSSLQEYALYLYGGWLFRRLLSLSAEQIGGKKRAFLILVIASQARDYVAYEYNLSACRFIPAIVENPGNYLCGLECWAADLMAVLSGRSDPRFLAAGHCQSWTSHGMLPEPVLATLFPFCHPLRRPEKMLAIYRELTIGIISDPVVRPRDRST